MSGLFFEVLSKNQIRNSMSNNQTRSEDSEFFNGIVDLAKSIQKLANDACTIYEPQVNAIIQNQSKDMKQIEWLLTYMLDFCLNDNMLLLFKKLCRYVYFIDPEIAHFYVNEYREMWDDDEDVEP